ncbi:hypothetical protein Pint_01534 [Pistacia integerrima]|uniref:Uncharacterized protein n=1 Tax=Pistacia integerrima TaxID=434235 RepID=A0ACC0ZP05_9ROSI|nr:hypothetical protein Pint_01534 [Pistacia integerrima]
MATSKLCLNTTVSLFILLCFSIAPPYSVHAQSTVRDTIKTGEMLGFSDQLTSADGRFVLGFFNPLNAAHRYLGIWFKDDPNNVVWVAQRTSPVYGSSGNLTMDSDGVLKIMQSGGNTIALNSNQAAKNSTATLETSGNFVLTELNPDGSPKQVLWQSFDFPTNTLLPGMKLGVNFRTGQTWLLTSWLSQQIATPGTFSLEWNNSSGTGQIVARRRGDIYWTSGSLNLNSRTFENVRGSQDKFNFSYVSNQNESYFTYSVLDGSTSRLVLDEKGAISNLLIDGVCYGYQGCAMSEPTCRSKDDDFLPQIGVFDGGSYLSEDNVSIGLSDCWTRCWNECSCIGYNTLNTDGTGCEFWNTDVNFTTAETNGRMPYVLSSALPPSSNNSSENGKWWMWLIIAVAGVLTWQLWREGIILELMDPTLADSCVRSQVLRCIHVGLLCVQEYAVDRPTMPDVISMLFNETVPLPTPKQTAFNTQQKLMEANLLRGEQESCSISVSAISEIEGR